MAKRDLFLQKIEFLKDVAPLKAGFEVEFTKFITVLVGDNGVGKSTITDAIASSLGKNDDTYLKRRTIDDVKITTMDKTFVTKLIDFHGDDRKFAGSFGNNLGLQLGQQRASSGQVTLSLLSTAKFEELKKEGGLLVMDEPDRGLSIKNQYGVSNLIFNLWMVRTQIILTTHSPIVLDQLKLFASYFDVGKGEYVEYNDYIKSQTPEKTL